MRAALRILALCAVLVAAQAASSSAHGATKGRGDGYNVPISKNSAWKFYKFNVTTASNIFTSFRPAPGATSPYQEAPGTIVTGMGELFNEKAEQVGVNQWSATAVGLETDTKKNLIQFLVKYEFGAPGTYSEFALTTATIIKRGQDNGLVDDYITHITGGSGKFLGATGQAREFFKDGDRDHFPTVLTFEVWVPNNLPK